jgi:hypothetical protein
MFRSVALWTLTDVLETRWLRCRGTVRVFAGRLLGDEFMKLAGRNDLNEAHRRPLPGLTLRRAVPRR